MKTMQEAKKQAKDETTLLKLEIGDQQQFASSLLQDSETPPALLHAMAKRKYLRKQ